MQATIEISTKRTPAVSQDMARRSAQTYLADVLGANYDTGSSYYEKNCWVFSIRGSYVDVKQSFVVGHISIDAQTGAVISLTPDDLREIRECTEWEAARLRGELARDAAGYISRHQARRLARRWLDHHLSMKYGASGGLLIPLEPPVWQFSVYFHLHDVYLEPLAIIDVDARSGEVKPLSDEQLAIVQERVRAIIQHGAPPATA
jgi:hypothetical protein